MFKRFKVVAMQVRVIALASFTEGYGEHKRTIEDCSSNRQRSLVRVLWFHVWQYLLHTSCKRHQGYEFHIGFSHFIFGGLSARRPLPPSSFVEKTPYSWWIERRFLVLTVNLLEDSAWHTFSIISVIRDNTRLALSLIGLCVIRQPDARRAIHIWFATKMACSLSHTWRERQ